jgi:hypothetical protein
MIIYVFKRHENFSKTMKIVEFFSLLYRENGLSQSRNFCQAGAGARAAQKRTGSATLVKGQKDSN